MFGGERVNKFANCPWNTLDWEVIIFIWPVVSWQETSWNTISCLYLFSPGLKKCKKWHILPHFPLVWESICVTVCAHQQFVVLYDTEQFGPLSKAFLSQQECTDTSVFHQVHGSLLRWPLVTHLLPLPILLFLIVWLIWTAHGIRVIIWEHSWDSDNWILLKWMQKMLYLRSQMQLCYCHSSKTYNIFIVWC